ncbi:MAG: LysM peptidoglycan-binding domain-containing protein [Pirellulaceae bacterium]
MKEFVRLGVGIILLLLAIFLSLNLDGEPSANSNNSSAEQPVEGESNPQWQAETVQEDRATHKPLDSEIVRPDFGTVLPASTGPAADSRLNSPGGQPPQISDEYRPLQPFVVHGQLQRDNELVPVQPKPSFTGSISYVREVHVVRRGDTLQSISREFFGTPNRYLDIYTLNKDVLAHPGTLPQGVELKIPN